MTHSTIKQLTIKAILEYIEDNIEVKSIDIESIVCFSGYSRRYLQSLFKSHMGVPIGRYIQLRRVSRAAVLLRLTSLSLVSIAGKLCYDSQQTFTREFKKNTGFTPLQYRNSNLWTFKNLTGPKEPSIVIPKPKLCYLDENKFKGMPMSYEEDIPFWGENSDKKWNYVKKYFTENKESYIAISHDVNASARKKVRIKLIFWFEKERHNHTTGVLTAGTYAKFEYTGSIKNYIHYINNVYMNSLPFYGLQKKNVYDLEIIHKDKDDSYRFEYYLPICNKT
ncbi:helix-turn-helix domain-containing protein [Escherichia coli]|nr:helix-turn-helix domain-containing protein [Escherichia coli]